MCMYVCMYHSIWNNAGNINFHENPLGEEHLTPRDEYNCKNVYIYIQ